MPKSLRHHTHHINKRLQIQLRLYFLITLILLGLLIYNFAKGSISLEYGILGVGAGIIIGIIASRMYHISWNSDANKVVGKLDRLGVIILIGYILFEVFREHIVSYFTHGAQVGAVGFAILAGVMFGRILGMRGKIIKVLEEQKVFG